MNWIKKLIKKSIIGRYLEQRKMDKLRKKRIAEIKKRDPHIYK